MLGTLAVTLTASYFAPRGFSGVGGYDAYAGARPANSPYYFSDGQGPSMFGEEADGYPGPGYSPDYGGFEEQMPFPQEMMAMSQQMMGMPPSQQQMMQYPPVEDEMYYDDYGYPMMGPPADTQSEQMLLLPGAPALAVSPQKADDLELQQMRQSHLLQQQQLQQFQQLQQRQLEGQAASQLQQLQLEQIQQLEQMQQMRQM